MSKTLKQICDAAGIRSSLGKQSSYFGSGDETLAYLANEAVAELVRHPWQLLRTEGTVAMTTATTYALPSDILYFVSDTMNADGQERFIKFPTATDDFWYHKTHSPSGIRYKIRLSGDLIEILNPDSGIDLKFEYISNLCIKESGEDGVTASLTEFENDENVWCLDDELLIKDLKWRYKREKGIEGWEADKMIFNEYITKLKGQEAGSRSLDFSGGGQPINAIPYTDLYV